jgi:hypothetical protein
VGWLEQAAALTVREADNRPAAGTGNARVKLSEETALQA